MLCNNFELLEQKPGLKIGELPDAQEQTQENGYYDSIDSKEYQEHLKLWEDAQLLEKYEKSINDSIHRAIELYLAGIDKSIVDNVIVDLTNKDFIPNEIYTFAATEKHIFGNDSKLIINYWHTDNMPLFYFDGTSGNKIVTAKVSIVPVDERNADHKAGVLAGFNVQLDIAAAANPHTFNYTLPLHPKIPIVFGATRGRVTPDIQDRPERLILLLKTRYLLYKSGNGKYVNYITEGIIKPKIKDKIHATQATVTNTKSELNALRVVSNNLPKREVGSAPKQTGLEPQKEMRQTIDAQLLQKHPQMRRELDYFHTDHDAQILDRRDYYVFDNNGDAKQVSQRLYNDYSSSVTERKAGDKTLTLFDYFVSKYPSYKQELEGAPLISKQTWSGRK